MPEDGFGREKAVDSKQQEGAAPGSITRRHILCLHRCGLLGCLRFLALPARLGQPIIAGSHRQGLAVKMFKKGDPAGKNALSARAELGPKWVEYVKSETVTCFD
jgi:hypothetical protein